MLLFWRLPLLRAKTKLESLLSREATFLYNNLLLVALCLTILWGVLFPILTEAVRGEAVTVGRPYYNFFFRAFGLPLLLLMGIGPLIAWRRASLASLKRVFLWPTRFALAVGGGADRRSAPALRLPGLIAYTFSAFVIGDDRPRVRARNRPRGARLPRVRAACVRGARRPQPPPLRRLHRPRRDRPARDRDRGLERLRHLAQRPARARRSP